MTSSCSLKKNPTVQSDRLHCEGGRGVRPLVRLPACAVQASTNRGQEYRRLLLGHAGGVERCVWEQAAWSKWATADGHAVATILYDLLKAFDHVAYQKLIDAAAPTRFPVRQLTLLLSSSTKRGGAAGATRHHPGVRIRDDAPPTAAGGTASGGASGASDCVHSCRGR